MGYSKKKRKDGMPKKHDQKKRKIEKNWTHQGPRKKKERYTII